MTLPQGLRDALRAQLHALERGLSALATLDRLHEDNRSAAEHASREASARLAAAALPSLEEPVLDEAAARFALPALAPAEVRRILHERRESLAARQKTVRADPRLDGALARIAALEQRAREIVGPAADLRQSVASLERDRDFQELLALGDDRRWWTFSFHRAKAAGERAFERHGRRRGCADASALAKKYASEREALMTLEEELRVAGSERAALQALVDEADSLERERAGLLDRVLGELRGQLCAHAESLPDDVLLSRLSDPPLREHARRVSGSRARARYLEALFAHFIDRPRGALLSHLQDVALVLEEGAAAGRRGAGDTPHEVEADTRRRQRELEDLERQYRSTAERLLAFTRWDEVDPLAGQLWWDAFVGELVDGSFIDEVVWHRTMRGPRARRTHGGGVDKREGWAQNALAAMDALAEAHAAVLAGETVDGDEDAQANASIPAPVVLGGPESSDE